MRKKGNTVLAGLIICLLLVFLAAAGKLFGAYGRFDEDLYQELVSTLLQCIQRFQILE